MKGPRVFKLVMSLLIMGLVAGSVFLARRVLVPAPEPSGTASGRTFGSPGAPVTIVEFTDFQCPACANASLLLHQALAASSGRIFLEVKYFPLKMHQNARRAAAAAECAIAQGGFRPMHDVLFKSQTSWANLPDPSGYFQELARGLGMDDAAMARCLDDSAVASRVQADIDEGERRGVSATPTFFINGKMTVGAANLETALKEVLNQHAR